MEADILSEHGQGMVSVSESHAWSCRLPIDKHSIVTPLDSSWGLKFSLTTSQLDRWNSLGAVIVKGQAE